MVGRLGGIVGVALGVAQALSRKPVSAGRHGVGVYRRRARIPARCLCPGSLGSGVSEEAFEFALACEARTERSREEERDRSRHRHVAVMIATSHANEEVARN